MVYNEFEEYILNEIKEKRIRIRANFTVRDLSTNVNMSVQTLLKICTPKYKYLKYICYSPNLHYKKENIFLFYNANAPRKALYYLTITL